MEEKYTEECECNLVHESVVERVRATMPDEDTLCDIAELFKVFGDSTRTRIISALFEAELCVCDIAELLSMTKSAVSHQLRILRQTKIVKNRKSGKEKGGCEGPVLIFCRNWRKPRRISVSLHCSQKLCGSS